MYIVQWWSEELGACCIDIKKYKTNSIFYALIYSLLLLYRKVKKGSLLIDSSTIDPAVSKEMAVAAEKMGAVFMDAPVSGGKSMYPAQWIMWPKPDKTVLRECSVLLLSHPHMSWTDVIHPELNRPPVRYEGKKGEKKHDSSCTVSDDPEEANRLFSQKEGIWEGSLWPLCFYCVYFIKYILVIAKIFLSSFIGSNILAISFGLIYFDIIFKASLPSLTSSHFNWPHPQKCIFIKQNRSV